MNMPSEILDRLPPQDLHAERAVIGSAMQHSAVLDDLDAKPEEFYADAHAKLWRTLMAMHDARQPIDAHTLGQRLVADGNFEATGGAETIIACHDAAPVWQHAAYYAQIVRNKAKARAIILAAQEALRDAHDPMQTPDEVLDASERAFSEIRSGDNRTQLVTAEQAVIKALDRIDAITQRHQEAGLLTGFQEFDDTIGGLFDGELIVLAARSGVGKTSLACQIADHNAAKGRLVYFASLEMDPEELETRLLCAEAGVDSRRLRTNRITQDDYRRIAEASYALATRSIRFDPKPELTVADVRRSARRLMREDLRLVVLDYLQILTPDNERENRERQVAKMAKDLKTLARELKRPVLVLCQTNREAEKDKTASLRHLRESDAIGQNADVVLILEVGAVGTDKANEAWLSITKNRNGPRGKLRLDWIPEQTRFACHVKAIEEFDNYEPAFDTAY